MILLMVLGDFMIFGSYSQFYLLFVDFLFKSNGAGISINDFLLFSWWTFCCCLHLWAVHMASHRRSRVLTTACKVSASSFQPQRGSGQ